MLRSFCLLLLIRSWILQTWKRDSAFHHAWLTLKTRVQSQGTYLLMDVCLHSYLNSWKWNSLCSFWVDVRPSLLLSRFMGMWAAALSISNTSSCTNAACTLGWWTNQHPHDLFPTPLIAIIILPATLCFSSLDAPAQNRHVKEHILSSSRFLCWNPCRFSSSGTAV